MAVILIFAILCRDPAKMDDLEEKTAYRHHPDVPRIRKHLHTEGEHQYWNRGYEFPLQRYSE
ncbi:hypothetical protein J6590_103317 [Homalodisca vitripennis]|nr:hypothetical protein J6590_103317 [Homalodisca vitripennis]